MSKKQKTNACRILDQHKISYILHEYYDSTAISGKDVADFLNENHDEIYKTLVLQGKSGEYYVMIVSAAAKIDLKKAAKFVGEKSIQMIPQKDLEALTGYVHGGCSPIGMKKIFKTVIQSDAFEKEKIYLSAGRVGLQLEINPNDLQKVISIQSGDIIEE
ncbi:MAG: Cys-tRNA(Pro) deacylase [Clostridia bacterium]|nr:Cys-tRNA(Pro) deacylase [Clostridia bacterium]